MEKELLSKYIAYKRKQVGLNQKELAALLSYTPQAISRFESVNSAFPLDFADSLCKVLDCSIDDIFLRRKEATHYIVLPFGSNDIGQLLKAKREASGKSQTEMASIIGISARSLRNYESGSSGVCLQFIESFCEALGIVPSELVVKEDAKEEPTSVPHSRIPFYRRRVFVFALAGALVLLAIPSIVVPISISRSNALNIDRDSSSSTTESQNTSITSIISPSSSVSSGPRIGKFGLEIKDGAPGFLKVEYEKSVFSSLGDTIDITLSDAYDGTPINLYNDHSFRLNPTSTSETFSIDYEIVSENQVRLTLLNARNWEGTGLNMCLGKYWYNSLGFLTYKNSDPVYLKSDVSHSYPITRASVHSDWKNEVYANVDETNFVSYRCSFFNGAGLQEFDGKLENGGLSLECITADGWTMTSRSEAHTWTIGVFESQDAQGCYGYVEIPKQIETDSFIQIEGFKTLDENGEEYWAMMDPLYIHIRSDILGNK